MTEDFSHETEHRLQEIEKKLDKLSNDVEDLVSAWKAANFLLSVIKGLGAIAVAVGSVILLLKGGK